MTNLKKEQQLSLDVMLVVQVSIDTFGHGPPAKVVRWPMEALHISFCGLLRASREAHAEVLVNTKTC